MNVHHLAHRSAVSKCASWLAGAAVLALLHLTQAFASSSSSQQLRPAPLVRHASLAPMTDVARAGPNLVAVGDHGVILLSDDEGAHWAQAKAVPFDGLLNSVTFADARHGWAVGHAGTILHTEDGGYTWQLQRSDTTSDRPLFAVHFFDHRNGVAVGLWSLVLATQDGGHTWREVKLPPPPGGTRADMSLFYLFRHGDKSLFATSERGFLLRSDDMGLTWSYLSTGGAGSLWCGISLGRGRLVAAGVGGNTYASSDGGLTWTKSEVASRGSIVRLAKTNSGLAGVTSEGAYLTSDDDANSFHLHAIDPAPTVVSAFMPLQGGHNLLLTGTGPLRARLAPAK